MSPIDLNTCPICEGNVNNSQPSGTAVFSFECSVCGTFACNVVLFHTLRNHPDRHLLQGYIREQTAKLLRDRSPDLIPRFCENRDIEEVIQLAPRSIQSRADRLLESLVDQSEWFGSQVTVSPTIDFPLAYAINGEEFVAFLRFLINSSLIESEDVQVWTSGDLEGTRFALQVTAAGFEHIRLRAEDNKNSSEVFVAMRFDDDMNFVYEDAIAPAIMECGFEPRRVDLEEHNGEVVDRMLAMIRTARFVVADFTAHRNGVYFEAGFAMGLGMPVIWCCKQEQMGDAHFDTNHFNHVVWPNSSIFRERLKLRILATVGQGPVRTEH